MEPPMSPAIYPPAGGDLFKLHGNGWFKSRPHLFDGNFALLGDYQKGRVYFCET
jgi:hypothetical protein